MTPRPDEEARWRPPEAIAVRAPMKLVLAGEYAVLEPGSFGIVAAVTRHVTCTARAIPRGVTIAAPGLGPGEARSASPTATGDVGFELGEGDGARKLVFACLGAELAYRHIAALGLAPRPLALRCTDDGGALALPDGTRRKLGLGTSAAATVAVAGAVLGAHGIPIDRSSYRRQLLRLALVAHTRAQGGHGSGIDVAASAVGGILEYGRADPAWVRKVERVAFRGATESGSADTGPESAKGKGDAARGTPRTPEAAVLEIARGAWPQLHVEPLPPASGMRLLVGFTGESASTPDLIARVDAWRRERTAEHAHFIRESQHATSSLAASFRKGDRNGVLAGIMRARRALLFLATRSGTKIETHLLERLAVIAVEAGGAGKLSGAGGGDCGIGIAFDDETAAKIEAGWRAEGITPVPLEVTPTGLQEVAPDGAQAEAR